MNSVKKTKILIVEDEGIIAMDVKRRLERAGYQVTGIADNSADTFLSVGENRPDLVMMDIIIQGERDGIETAMDLRKICDIPVVFLTSHSDPATVQRAKTAMPYGYLVKPFQERELATTLEMALYRHQAEKRLAEQATMLNEASDAIISTDTEWCITFWNRGAERIYGWKSEEVVGRPVAFMSRDVNAGEDAETQTSLIRTGVWAGELTQVTKDGRPITVCSHQTLINDHSSVPKAILMINSDITERKAIELKVQQTQRLESIGTLAGGLAHDLNNALSPALMGLDVIQDHLQADEMRSLVEVMKSGILWGADIVRQLMRFSKDSTTTQMDFAPGRLLMDVTKVAKHTFAKGIHVEPELPGDLWQIRGDPTQFHQVVLNLCINAGESMPEGGTLKVVAKNVEVDALYAAANASARKGPHVCISVTDTGGGIPSELLERVFEPFVSTTPEQKGTRMGLFIVYSIVREHGGFVVVESELGRGTCVKAHFPALPGATKHHESSEDLEAPRGKKEWILLVNDDSNFRNTARQTLEHFGYRVVTAEDGASGLIAFMKQRDEIRAVLTGLRLPRLSGIDMCRALKEHQADLGIVVTANMPDSAVANELISTMGISVVNLPCISTVLLSALRSAIKDEGTVLPFVRESAAA